MFTQFENQKQNAMTVQFHVQAGFMLLFHQTVVLSKHLLVSKTDLTQIDIIYGTLGSSFHWDSYQDPWEIVTSFSNHCLN